MTKFYNLDEAFGFRRYCPCKHCSHTLFPEGATIKYGENYREVQLSVHGNTLTVNLHSNEVISYRDQDDDHKRYSMSMSTLMYASPSRKLWSLSKSGTDMFPLVVSCNNCHGYSYVLQVHVALDQGRIVKLVLNSESMSVEDMAKRYTIKNIYTTNKTEMEIRHTHVSQVHEPQDKIEIPLVPLNVEDPMKTVERVKKLVVFL